MRYYWYVEIDFSDFVYDFSDHITLETFFSSLNNRLLGISNEVSEMDEQFFHVDQNLFCLWIS